MIHSILLGFFFFLLSADLLYLPLGEGRLKLAYLMIPLFWLKNPKKILQSTGKLFLNSRKYFLLGGLLAIISVITSHNIRQSAIWLAWLGFNLFTLFSIYGYLKANEIEEKSIIQSSYIGLGLIALFGIIQYFSIYGMNLILFSPQFHNGIYRINGLSGWPHFLNIFSFLLLPIALSKKSIKIQGLVVIGCILFILFHSTSKTGWILFFGMSVLFAIKMRDLFFKSVLKITIPLVFFIYLLPSTPFQTSGPDSNKYIISQFAKDLKPSQNSSGKDRILINIMGLKVFGKHALFGIGPRAYGDYVTKKFDLELPGENKYDVMGQFNTRNENIWIELLAENGILFTLFVVLIVFQLLRMKGTTFTSPLHFGSWCSLILYYSISGQFSQNILASMTFAIWGVFFYARELNKSS